MVNPLFDALFAPHQGNATPFLILPDGRELSYDAFLRHAGQMAHALSELGVTAGDRVAAQVEKSADALALYAACVASGAVFLPLNTAYTPAELSYFIADSGARVFLCDPAHVTAMGDLAKTTGTSVQGFGAAGEGSFLNLARHQPGAFAPVDRALTDLAALLYTSGTTGRSKGAMLTQGNLLSNADALVAAWQFTKDDVLLHALPIFHTHGLFVATNTLLRVGGAMIFVPKFDLDTVLGMMPLATSMMGVPTFYTRLLGSERFTADLVRHMRLFISGSAPLLAETHSAFEVRTGHRILERYGMTETNMTTSNPYHGTRRAGSVGQALPGVEIRICDPETGKPCPEGQVGMLHVRGPNVFKGYWNMPEKTREELREDGFFITGDLATRDADGYVQIVGRSKDLIISGGLNIYPKEIEQVLDALPGVLESAVIGAPHPDFGESVVAVLVPDGTVDLTAEEVLEGMSQALRDTLAGFKRPRAIRLMEALPRNAMGKVQKAQLRRQFSDVFIG